MLSAEQKDLAERARQAMEEYHRLPIEEQTKRLLASGLVDENGQLIDRGPGDLRSATNGNDSNGAKNGNGKSHS